MTYCTGKRKSRAAASARVAATIAGLARLQPVRGRLERAAPEVEAADLPEEGEDALLEPGLRKSVTLLRESGEVTLVDAGYPSIGCAPCTRPVAPGEDPRAGRWAGFAKTECGIHT